jgi:dCMP deaminase
MNYTNNMNDTSATNTTNTTNTDERQRQFDISYLQMARIWGQNSYCKRRQVGALLVKNRIIISDGYNGTPAGFENICEDKNGATKPYVLHAEANAITKVAKSNNSSAGATLYSTMSPCVECAKLIIQAEIRRVVYAEHYHDTAGIELLCRAGVDVQQISLD